MPDYATKTDTTRIERTLEKFATKVELKGLEVRLNKKLDKIMETLDGFVGTVDDLRTDNIVGAEQFRDHEKRISKLESAIHPQ